MCALEYLYMYKEFLMEFYIFNLYSILAWNQIKEFYDFEAPMFGKKAYIETFK